jgi:catechol 2,3-dioxygenase-like lactoylglutathione lyase family enzyme
MGILSHVDVRVRDRKRAHQFYSLLLGELGVVLESDKGLWTSYIDPGAEAGDWFAFTEDRAMEPGPTRVALAARSREVVDRVARRLAELGAQQIDGPSEAYGPRYYAVFFEDPDGNKLEVCHIAAD